MTSPQALEYVREALKTPAYGAPGNEFNLEGLRQGMAARQPPIDSQVRCTPFHLGTLPCEWVVAPAADPSVRLLYLHGGGYVSGSGAHYAGLAALISSTAQCAVLILDYRLAPEHPFPAGLEDALEAFSWMQSHGPDLVSPATATFIAGDSAGGGLTLAALLALRDRQLPLPAAGIALSAFADLNLSSESMQSQAHTDPIMSPGCLPTFVDLYLAGSDPYDPLASPVLADYSGIPPLLLQVGDFEVIRDDSIRVATRAEEHGVQVQLEVWPDMVHVFQVRGLPESQEAIDNIAAFIRSHRR